MPGKKPIVSSSVAVAGFVSTIYQLSNMQLDRDHASRMVLIASVLALIGGVVTLFRPRRRETAYQMAEPGPGVSDVRVLPVTHRAADHDAALEELAGCLDAKVKAYRSRTGAS